MQKFTTYITCIALLACGLLLTYRGILPTSKLTLIEGTVEETQIEPVSTHKGHLRYGLTFKVDHYDNRIGIYIGTKSQADDSKWSTLVDTNKIYQFLVDPTVVNNPGVNLGIRQISFNGKTIYKEPRGFTLFAGIFLTLLSAIGLFLMYTFKK